MVRLFALALAALTCGCATVNASSSTSFGTYTAAAPGWTTSRENGEASGNQSCFVHSPGFDVMVHYFKHPSRAAPLLSVSVGYDNYPGSFQYLAVDGQRFSTSEDRFDGREAAEIIAAIRSGTTLAFEWSEWPNYQKHEGRVSLSGASARLDQCEAWLGKP